MHQPQTLPFQKVQHIVTTLDAQPSNESGGILVMVTGGLKVLASERSSELMNVHEQDKH